MELTREQSDLIGKGYAGPAVELDDIKLTDNQVTCTLSSILESVRVLLVQKMEV